MKRRAFTGAMSTALFVGCTRLSQSLPTELRPNNIAGVHGLKFLDIPASVPVNDIAPEGQNNPIVREILSGLQDPEQRYTVEESIRANEEEFAEVEYLTAVTEYGEDEFHDLHEIIENGEIHSTESRGYPTGFYASGEGINFAIRYMEEDHGDMPRG